MISGIELIINQDYANAKEVFYRLDEKFPKIPLGNIYLAATEITKAVDYEEELNEEFVDSLLDLSKEKNDLIIEEDGESIWTDYYEALIYGYKAYYTSISGNIISALADGFLSLKSYQKCLEKDNEFYEAYIALGTYGYWKSAQTKSLLWIPFVHDNRDEGIEYLEKSLSEFSYNKFLAAYSLIWIYIDYEQSKKAIELAQKMLKQYPDTRFFKWGLARAYQDINKNKAIEIFYEILNSIEVIENRNGYNDVVLKHKIAMLYNELGENEKSLSLCNQALDFKIKSVKIKRRLKKRIERLLKLKEELTDKLKVK
ncbi:MAG: hypothetical protein CR986_04585 [Ignavibacteriae bacterium]|nr:MAG: hypothetical protein CR986_04585 [Ignavibacteriota bacterium]